MAATIETVWNDYRHTLKRFLLSKISSPEDADDLLQVILLKVHQNLDQLDDVSKIKSWLFTLSNNTVTDFYRHRATRKHPDARDLWYEEEESEQGLADCVQPFIDQLDPESRHLLKQIDIEGKSQKHVAEEMSIPYTTLKSRVAKARAELKRQFTSCCEIQLDASGKAMIVEEKGCASC